MKQKELLFTGQEVVGIIYRQEVVNCPKCNTEVNVRSSAYFDSFQDKVNFPKGAYVHYGCLSDKRKNEIEKGDPSKFSARI